MRKIIHAQPHLRRMTAILLALAILFSLSVTGNLSVFAAETVSAYKIIFHVNHPEIENKNTVFKSFGSDKLNADNSLTHFYEIPDFAGDEYVFRGWYHSADYGASAASANIPVDFDSNTAGRTAFPPRGSDYHIYAKWIKVDTVAKDSDDANNIDDYRGFGLAGVQIREENVYDSNVDGSPKITPGGIRFVTSISESLLNQVAGIEKISAVSSDAADFGVKYGYVVGTADNIRQFVDHYKKNYSSAYKLQVNDSDVNGVDTSGSQRTAATDYRYITNVDCTSDQKATAGSGVVAEDHKNFDAYRLYTLVVTYEGDSASKKDAKIDARAYLRYCDANGKLRVFYNDYKNAQGDSYYGGCMCSYNQALSAQANEHIEWHQCPQAVRNYLAYMEEHPYPEGDYSYSYVEQFATNISYMTKYTHPLGLSVDGVTYYDMEPDCAVPFITTNKTGTITFLDKVRWIRVTYQSKAEASAALGENTGYGRGINTRDIGGWSCGTGDDGKPCTVKYGLLYRGGELNAVDRELMVDKLGIKSELQLLPLNEQTSDRKMQSVWGIDWYGNDTTNSSVYGIESNNTNNRLWRIYLNAVFDSIADNKPIYIHCGVGADRTGTVMIVLEGLLGMTENEICQDYELTCFSNTKRTRLRDGYNKLVTALMNVPLADGLSEDTIENHTISYVLSLGFTAEQINAFRNACINGNPKQIGS